MMECLVKEEDQADIILVPMDNEPDPPGLLADAQSIIDHWRKLSGVLGVNQPYEWLERNRFIGETEEWGGYRLTNTQSV